MPKVRRLVELEDRLLKDLNIEGLNPCMVISNFDMDIANAIRGSKPYDDSGDLISRSALKKDLESIPIGNHNADWLSGIITAIEHVEKIDSAPEVFTLEDMQINYDLGAASEAARHDRPNDEWVSLDSVKRVIAKLKGYLDDAMIARIQTALENESGAENEE